MTAVMVAVLMAAGRTCAAEPAQRAGEGLLVIHSLRYPDPRHASDRPVFTRSHCDQLKDLEWMIGTWLDESDDDQIETTCQWARNNKKERLQGSYQED